MTSLIPLPTQQIKVWLIFLLLQAFLCLSGSMEMKQFLPASCLTPLLLSLLVLNQLLSRVKYESNGI